MTDSPAYRIADRLCNCSRFNTSQDQARYQRAISSLMTSREMEAVLETARHKWVSPRVAIYQSLPPVLRQRVENRVVLMSARESPERIEMDYPQVLRGAATRSPLSRSWLVLNLLIGYLLLVGVGGPAVLFLLVVSHPLTHWPYFAALGAGELFGWVFLWQQYRLRAESRTLEGTEIDPKFLRAVAERIESGGNVLDLVRENGTPAALPTQSPGRALGNT